MKTIRHSDRSRFAILLTMALILLTSGCINLDPVSDTTQFYVLQADRKPARTGSSKQVLVRNLNLADYLQNSQIAKREGPNRITYMANHRWAGSLDKMIAEVTAEELGNKYANVSASTLSTGNEDAFVDVSIQRFDFGPGNQVTVILEYTVIDAETRKTLAHDWIKNYKTSPNPDNIEEIVALMETALRDGLLNVKLEN